MRQKFITKCVMYYKVWQAAFRLFVFPGPRPLAWSLALALAPGPCPNLYLPALAFIRLSPKFVFAGPNLLYYYQSGAWVLHTPTFSTQFLIAFTALYAHFTKLEKTNWSVNGNRLLSRFSLASNECFYKKREKA